MEKLLTRGFACMMEEPNCRGGLTREGPCGKGAVTEGD